MRRERKKKESLLRFYISTVHSSLRDYCQSFSSLLFSSFLFSLSLSFFYILYCYFFFTVCDAERINVYMTRERERRERALKKINVFILQCSRNTNLVVPLHQVTFPLDRAYTWSENRIFFVCQYRILYVLRFTHTFSLVHTYIYIYIFKYMSEEMENLKLIIYDKMYFVFEMFKESSFFSFFRKVYFELFKVKDEINCIGEFFFLFLKIGYEWNLFTFIDVLLIFNLALSIDFYFLLLFLTVFQLNIQFQVHFQFYFYHFYFILLLITYIDGFSSFLCLLIFILLLHYFDTFSIFSTFTFLFHYLLFFLYLLLFTQSCILLVFSIFVLFSCNLNFYFCFVSF